MKCVYCGEETGTHYDEHDRCVEQAAMEGIEARELLGPLRPVEWGFVALLGIVALAPILVALWALYG